ncbi:hypothetical protein ONA70_33495 [Micromonospora yasonensis]|uniref:hypothetical protein n=1 Tax=Micromonospora yasonensis TaxID=1128667 RepID=UPI00223069FB|nr:hypothetical protein [Micromonospora yasonensis]MCW3844994.1 hypothetical protein [Micromonospora yasonensis]
MSQSENPPGVKIETFVPEYLSQEVSLEEARNIYQSLGKASASFTWNDCGDEVLTLSVGEDHSTATLLKDRSFCDLVYADNPGEDLIERDGSVVEYPRALILPREKGLELLNVLPDFDRLFESYRWRVQD